MEHNEIEVYTFWRQADGKKIQVIDVRIKEVCVLDLTPRKPDEKRSYKWLPIGAFCELVNNNRLTEFNP